MNPRLENVPVYASRPGKVSAEHYNLAQIALKRLGKGGSVRIPLPKLRTLELIIEPDAWIVIDAALNEVPVVAWIEFQARDRALHEPVACTVNHYHVHGGIVRGKVLEAMALILGERLSDIDDTELAKITPLERKPEV